MQERHQSAVVLEKGVYEVSLDPPPSWKLNEKPLGTRFEVIVSHPGISSAMAEVSLVALKLDSLEHHGFDDKIEFTATNKCHWLLRGVW